MLLSLFSTHLAFERLRLKRRRFLLCTTLVQEISASNEGPSQPPEPGDASIGHGTMLDVFYSMCFTCCTAALTGSTVNSMLTELTRQRGSTVVMNLHQGQTQADALVRALGDEKNLVMIENTVRRCAHAVAEGWMDAVPMPVFIGGVTVMGFTMCSQNYYYWSLGMDGKLGLPKGLLKALGLDGANGSGPAKDTCSKDEEPPKDAEARVAGPMGGTTAVMAADALSEKKKLKIENLALLERVAALETTAVMAADALSEKEKLKIENLALLERVAALETTAVMAADALSEKEKLKIENLALLERVAALEQANQALLARIKGLVSTAMFKETANVFATTDVGNTDLPKEASNEDWQI